MNTLSIDKTPEQIEAEMFETRESLTEKVAALENQVVGTVQNAANTLTDTVDAVKSFVATAPDAVSETVDNMVTAVREQVGKTFDISAQVQKNPWASVGASLGFGFLAGYFLFPGRRTPASSKAAPAKAEYSMPPHPAAEAPRQMASPREPGLLDELFGMLGKKVKEMTENVIDAASVAVNKNIREGVPKLVDGAAKHLVGENPAGV